MFKRILFLATFLLAGVALLAQSNADLMLKKTATIKGLCGNYDERLQQIDDGQPLVEVAKWSADLLEVSKELHALAMVSKNQKLSQLTTELIWTVRYQFVPVINKFSSAQKTGGGRTVGSGQVTEIIERIIKITDTIRREIQE